MQFQFLAVVNIFDVLRLQFLYALMIFPRACPRLGSFLRSGFPSMDFPEMKNEPIRCWLQFFAKQSAPRKILGERPQTPRITPAARARACGARFFVSLTSSQPFTFPWGFPELKHFRGFFGVFGSLKNLPSILRFSLSRNCRKSFYDLILCIKNDVFKEGSVKFLNS